MKNKTLISALVSVCLVAGSGGAFAQNHDDHRDDHRDDNRAQAEHHDDRGDHGDRRNDRAPAVVCAGKPGGTAEKPGS